MYYTAYGTQEFIDYLQKVENFDVKSFFLESSSVSAPDILSYESEDTAIISISGGLTRYAPHPIIKSFLGGTGYDEIIDAVDRAEENGAKTIKLMIDSPGGDAAGAQLTYDRIIKARDKGIHIVAINKGRMLSAGYYLASAANEILSESPDFPTGSIGTIIYSYSFREAEERAGIREIIIRSINAPNKGQPIDTVEGRQQAENMVNTYERFFLKAVSQGRNMHIADVINNFGGGSVFVAEDPDENKPDAISIGMIDGLADGYKRKEPKKINDLFLSEPARIERNQNTGGKVKMNSLSEVFAAHPALKFEFDAAINKAREEGILTAKEETQKRVTAASKILESEAYDKHVKGIAAKVITGESEISALDSIVAMADMLKERGVSTSAQEETAADGDTPNEPVNPAASAGPKSAQDYIAAHKALTGGAA
jgi:ClpP class serine protease